MATAIDLSDLTLYPKESTEFDQFIFERSFLRPELRQLHRVFSGVKMKEQIVFASLMGKTGLKGDATCTRKNSGATSNLTQKYWEPQGIEDTIVHCNAEVNALFKAYFDKISTYRQTYNIKDGVSDMRIFLSMLFDETIAPLVWRAVWHADTAVAAADAGTGGLVDGANVGFYNYFDGLWKQIFEGVTATDIKRYTITENAETTTAAQLNLSAGRSVEIFEEVYALADPRLKADPERMMYVSDQIWENYRKYLQDKSENFTIENTTEGFRQLMWNGIRIVNMETLWDLTLQADFVNNTTDNAYLLPNRVVFSTPANLAVATLNENDMSTLESWEERKDREHYFAFGFTLDAKVLEEYMITVAY